MCELTFETAILLGFTRCKTISFLVEYKDRWKSEIEAHEQKDAIIETYKARYREIQEEAAKVETELAERSKYDPSRKIRQMP